MIHFLLVGDDFPAAQTLQFLLGKENAQVAAIYSSVKRGFDPRLRKLAGDRDIPVLDSVALETSEEVDHLRRQNLDWIVNINSTVILPSAILALARSGGLNMHPGRLPEYAGLHTHQWALRNGEKTFAITIHFMEARLDTGDVILQCEFEVSPRDTGLTLYHKCMREGVRGLRQVLQMILDGCELPRQPQNLSRYRLYRHSDALEERIDWLLAANEIERFIRAGNYAPLRSPTYTACLDSIQVGGKESKIQVLAATPVDMPPSCGQPGTVVHMQSGAAVVIVCGDGCGLRLDQVRWEDDQMLIPSQDLCQWLPHGSCQKGRRF